jgi:hypothetical protein
MGEGQEASSPLSLAGFFRSSFWIAGPGEMHSEGVQGRVAKSSASVNHGSHILYEMRLFLTFFMYEHVKWFQKAKLCNVLADRG